MSTDTAPLKFGAFRGVFIPSILTILGVIMYLRIGWVVGNVGLVSTFVIVSLSTSITFLTGLSMSATASNMKVGGGGAYFLISRSFGIEAGAAIGLPLFLAQALGISFYIAGFSEVVGGYIPGVSEKLIGVISLTLLAVLAYVSANLALKMQTVVFIVILLSLVSFFFGSVPEGGFPEVPENLIKAPFWVAFAVFFPAVTGIEAGMAMSGDLKNPGRDLAIGTMAAIVVGYAVYMAIPYFLNERVPHDILVLNPNIMQDIALIGGFIFAGVCAATLSSALGALLGAPRTLQALAKDRLVPRILAKGEGEDNNPRVATAVAFIIALGGILVGDLNAIAPVLSMFFLTSYGFINLGAFVEELISNPSWRPTIRVPWFFSLLGTVLCFATMLMINAGATFMAFFACSAVFFLTQRRDLNARWADTRRGIIAFLARYSIYRLEAYPLSERSWRPNILVLSGAVSSRWYLVQLADAITHGLGFLTTATILPSSEFNAERKLKMENSSKEYLTKHGIPALTKITYADSLYEGSRILLQNYGLGVISPNILLMGESEKESNQLELAKIAKLVYAQKSNLVISRLRKNAVLGRHKNIDVWWGGDGQNAGLMLTLAYMLQTSPEWRGSKLTLKTIIKDATDQENKLQGLRDFISGIRIKAEAQVFVTQHNNVAQILQDTVYENSKKSDLVFIGMRAPKEEETDKEYCDYYRSLLNNTQNFPPTAIVLANESINFRDIFL